MASKQRQTSPESDLDPRYASITDDKKRKRMISNRESARRSRMRKQKQMEDLLNEIAVLKNENNKIMEKINGANQRYIEMESRNNIFRAQAMELTDRLRSLNSVLKVAEETSGLALEIPEIPADTIMNPWQISCPMQPMFEC